MKGVLKYVFVAIAAVTCVGLGSCREDVSNIYQKEEPGEPNDFDFSTKKPVEFTLKYNVSAGYNVHFEMYTKSPLTLDEYKSYVKDTTLVPFFSGRSEAGGKISFKGELPATVNEIYAYSSAIGVPTLMKATVSAEGVVSEFQKTEVKAARSARANEGGPSGTNTWTTYSVTLNKPTLSAVSMTISDKDKGLIDKSFAANQNYEIIKTYYQPSIKLTGDATVKIYSVSHAQNSDRTNALAYFVYDESKDASLVPADINSELQLLFPKLTKNDPAEGQGYQLLNGTEAKFKAGSRIGFALFPNVDDNIKTDNTHLLYSFFASSGPGGWNTYNYPHLLRANVPHMVLSLLRKDENGHAIIAIGFEDQPWAATNDGTNRGDFRDDIFILEIDPASSLPGDLPTPPTDEPAYDTEYKTSGILCFEDCWPTKGDYDINDIVIAYERVACISYAKNGPVAMKENFTFLHNGANYMNGFGYQLIGLKQSAILKCTVESSYTCEGQGLDKTLDDATIMLFDNGRSIKKGTAFKVYTSFNNPGYRGEMNPFLVVRGGEFATSSNFLSKDRTEVHLPTSVKNAMYKYFPTAKANTNYWGKEDDRSKPSDNIYYVREGNYPFALDLNWETDKHGRVEDFIIPNETKSIETTYPKFTNWVNTKGDKDKDWYLHPTK